MKRSNTFTSRALQSRISQPVSRMINRLACFAALTALFFGAATTSHAQCPNLIKNGDFSLGNTGFTSDLAYQGSACAAGHYFVGTKFTDECSLWNSTLNPNQNDHTTGSGKYLIIDGDNKAAADVWKKSLSNVCAGTYTFSFYAKNVYGSSGAFPLAVYINGNPVLTVSVNTPGWTQYSVTWTGTPTSLAIRQTTAGEKRDFGIDDIYFADCPGSCTPQ